MSPRQPRDPKRIPSRNRLSARQNERGIAALELAVILPVLLVLIFGVIDFGRLLQAKLILANVSREGASLASRDIRSAAELCILMLSSAQPLDLDAGGKVFISRISAGMTAAAPEPVISSQAVRGSLAVTQAIRTGAPHLGLSPALYNHLMYRSENGTSDIAELTVVEVFYKFQPVTPLPRFVQNLLLEDGGGLVLGCKSVF